MANTTREKLARAHLYMEYFIKGKESNIALLGGTRAKLSFGPPPGYLYLPLNEFESPERSRSSEERKHDKAPSRNPEWATERWQYNKERTPRNKPEESLGRAS